ncbi:Chloride channel protein D [Lamellibrachia satsuma]|nr:Chloride channel protein D [Lamellibrachia satsuma]
MCIEEILAVYEATQQGDEEETMATKLSTGSLQIRYSRIAKRRQATLAELILNDDDVVYPRDDRATFFEQGRELEGFNKNHKYTEEELEMLSSFESHNYLPFHSVIYKEWLKANPVPKLDWDMWFTVSLIGVAVGVIGFLLHETVEVITHFKWIHALHHIQHGELWKAWAWVMGYSIVLVISSSSLVVFMRPSAAASGIPTLISFLNGTIIPNIFTLDVMMVKFVSCCFAVASGLPVGPEGPMIHLGSLIGAGVSQYKSDLFNIKLSYFERFQTPNPGAAAGVASAFHAPIGALLFCMEELSSFWNIKLALQIFFCAMISTVTTDFLQSCFSKLRYNGMLGLLVTGNIFKLDVALTLNIAVFIPAALLGAIGGLLGAAFTIMHLKIIRLRRRMYIYIKHKSLQNIVKVFEPVVIMTIVASMSVLAPALFPCTEYRCSISSAHNATEVITHCVNSASSNVVHTTTKMVTYMCNPGVFIDKGNVTWTNKTYSENSTYYEVAHGKGLSGGISGSYKQSADLAVRVGTVFSDVHNMLKWAESLPKIYLDFVFAIHVKIVLALVAECTL